MDHKLNVKFLNFYRKIGELFQGLVLDKELNLAPKQDTQRQTVVNLATQK